MTMNTSKLPSVRLPGASPRKSELGAQHRDADPDDDQGAADYEIPSTLEQLSDDELYELSQHEVVIQRGLKTFIEVGEALMAIREKRLYRQTYYTFEEYCQQRWDISRPRAYQLMGASQVVANLSTFVDTETSTIGNMPTNESQVRPLTKLETPEEQQAAWTEAVVRSPNGKPTGAIVAAVVDEMRNPHPLAPSPLRSEGEPSPHAGEPPVVEAIQNATFVENTLYAVTPSDNVHVERARQIALKAIGSDGDDLDDRIRGHQGHASSEYCTHLGGGDVLLNYGTPHARSVGYARNQIAVTLPVDGIERLFRFNAFMLMRWKLAQPEDEPVDDYVPDVEEVQAAGVGGAAVTAGATVWTPSGHEGTVLSVSGRLAMVKTVNGTRQYEIEKLMVVTGEDEEDGNGTPTGESIETFVEQTYEFASEAVKAKIIAEHYEKKAAERETRRLEMEARRLAALNTPLPTGKYRCLVIDPPWPVEKIERDSRPNQGATLDYPTMSLEDIQALPIADLADEGGCHLYLWTTQKFLPAALLMVQAWDFEYQCVMPWVKPSGMTPYSWMYNVEFVVFARRGGLALLQNGLKLSIEAPSEGHSIKPNAFYEKVLKASPEPRLDMFARRERKGFSVWGDEVEQAS